MTANPDLWRDNGEADDICVNPDLSKSKFVRLILKDNYICISIE